MKARVIVTLLADIPDSHGETVAQAIADAGYDSVYVGTAGQGTRLRNRG